MQSISALCHARTVCAFVSGLALVALHSTRTGYRLPLPKSHQSRRLCRRQIRHIERRVLSREVFAVHPGKEFPIKHLGRNRMKWNGFDRQTAHGRPTYNPRPIPAEPQADARSRSRDPAQWLYPPASAEPRAAYAPELLPSSPASFYVSSGEAAAIGQLRLLHTPPTRGPLRRDGGGAASALRRRTNGFCSAHPGVCFRVPRMMSSM